jgi:aerotaxis receptor
VVRHPDVPPAAFQNLWDEAKAGKSWMGVVKNRCKNGDHYWVDAYVTPLMDGETVVGYESVRMKPRRTDIRRAEKLYQRLNSGKSLRGSRRLNVSYGSRIFLGHLAILLPIYLVLIALAKLPLIATTLGLALAALGSYTVAQLSTRRLRKVAKDSLRVVNNPLTNILYSGGNDEVDQLVASNKMLKARINTVLNRIENATDGVNLIAQSTSSGAVQGAESMQQQQSEIHQLATAMDEMTATVEEVGHNAEHAAASANQAYDAANDGKLIMSKTVIAVDNLADEVERAKAAINQLSEESQSIGSVVDVINEIAEQTNLLALNAAIEAARAGEQGRGFAVVADEVRTLASRTQESTQEIQNMIQKLRDGIGSVVKVMETNHTQAQQGVEYVTSAGESLANIVGAVNTINDMNHMIASAAEEQTAVSAEINRNIHNINQHSDETFRLSENTLNSIHELAEYVRSLKELIRRFG